MWLLFVKKSSVDFYKYLYDSDVQYIYYWLVFENINLVNMLAINLKLAIWLSAYFDVCA